MPDRGKGGFNWITGADALPVLCWKVEECHEFLAVFLQAQRRLGVFGFVGFDEQIEGLVRIIFGLSLPDVVDRGFGLWLRQLGQTVEHIHSFVLPTALMAGLRIHFIQGGPKSHGTVSNRQFRYPHATAFKVEQNLAPALRGLAHPVLNGQEPFLATGCDPNNHKGAELVVLAPKAAVDTVSPDVDQGLVLC